jgi:hypothetical protein
MEKNCQDLFHFLGLLHKVLLLKKLNLYCEVLVDFTCDPEPN